METGPALIASVVIAAFIVSFWREILAVLVVVAVATVFFGVITVISMGQRIISG